MKRGKLWGVVAASLVVGCGGDGSSRDDGGGDGSSIGSATDDGATETAGTGASGSATEGPTGSAGSDSASASASATDADATGGQPKFDVGHDTEGTGGIDLCGCGNQMGFSYIWIANSTQSTVSKLNTQTMEEEGRYLTRSDGAGSPSRTSVSIDSRAVAVANRNGGVVKVWARPEFCDPTTNGQAGLQTATDLDHMAWGQDDCVAWYTHFDYNTQRPIAWGPGELDETTCEYHDQVVWTGGCNTAQHQWAQVHMLDGDTGVVLESVDVVGFECSSLSPYGAAIDPNGDYWMTNLVPGQDRLAHIAADGTLVEVITPPITPYGMTVDSKGRVWLAAWTGSGGNSAARYDPSDLSWALANDHVASSMSGIQEDAQGRMWMNYWTYDGSGANPGLVYIDGETMQVSDAYGIGCGSSACRGISIDLDGNVWSTSMSQNTAFRFDPETLAVDTYNQLVGPYTYSDMTGWALQNTSCTPPG